MSEQYDVIDLEILPDGRVKSEVDEVSAANHQSAEQFFRTLARLSGGDATRTPRSHKRHKHQHKERQKVKTK